MSEFHVGTRLEPTPICVMYPSGPRVWHLKSRISWPAGNTSLNLRVP